MKNLSNAYLNQNNNAKKCFASMDEEKQREIPGKGGKTPHKKNIVYEFSSKNVHSRFKDKSSFSNKHKSKISTL